MFGSEEREKEGLLSSVTVRFITLLRLQWQSKRKKTSSVELIKNCKKILGCNW
jgi:hypothetical protein